MERSDSELLRDARENADAFDAFYRRHARAVSGWFRLNASWDEQTVLDLTAETFAQALLNLERFRGGADGAGAAWLFGIARNLARQHHRRGRVEMNARRRLGLPLRSVTDDDPKADDSRVRAALAGLPREQRRAVELRVLDQLGYGEIAQAMACSEQSARLRVSRGLRRLRSQLGSKEVL